MLARAPDPDSRPRTHPAEERKYVHEQCRKFNLRSKSEGKGANRALSLFKKTSAAGQREEKILATPPSLELCVSAGALLP